MRKFFMLCCLFLPAAFALTPDQLPDSISIAAGDTVLRLDKGKRWYINRIDYTNRKMCLDSPGAHYGTVFAYADVNGFCGSGHIETGHVEEVQSISIVQDGREITAEDLKNGPVMGRRIEFEKRATVRDFSIVYRFTLYRNILDESIAVTADKDVKLKLCYHFMHPWRVDFDEMIAVAEDGSEMSYTFKGDGNFAMKGRARPFAAWYDRESGRGAATLLLPGENRKAMSRLVWDRNIYRKDYFADYFDSVFPKGTTATYHIRTGFFRSSKENWKQKAKALPLKKEP